MNIFDKEFFPTPEPVIRKMVEPYANVLRTATILEPSAGNGAILDFLTRKGFHLYQVPEKHVYAIEKNPELVMILQQKGYRVIAQDFLTFRPEHRFDLILMNPPFSNGDDHLLHAWDILDGGDIACLLNAETVRNAYTATRRRLKALIEQNGSVEFIGQVFHTADNPTDVEVALVRLHKRAKDDPFRIDIEGYTKEKAPDFGEMASQGDTPAVRNGLDAYIRAWELTKSSAADLIRAFARYRFFSSAFLASGRSDRSEGLVEHMMKSLMELRYDRSESLGSAYNDFIDAARANAWALIIEQIGLGKYMTSGLKKKLDEFRTAQSAAEISRENITMLFNFVMANIHSIMDQSLVEVYDLFTRYFKGNTSHDEGWKTNKRFRCNRKIILPDTADAGYMPTRYGYRRFFSVALSHSGVLDDIDKAMCWLTGTPWDRLDNGHCYGSESRGPSGPTHTLAAALTRIPVGSNDWHDSAFFRIKAFKKGTIHIEFKDEDVWNRFNLAVNQGKNELGTGE